MATPNTPVTLLSKPQEESLIQYVRSAGELLTNQFSIRSALETVDRYYMREGDFDVSQRRARNANLRGDKSKIQDVTVPIVMPQVESALSYLTNVFLTGYPRFGVTGAPDSIDAAMMMETIIAENSVTAGWDRQLLMFLRDGLKYNLHGIECEWDEKVTPTFETDLSYPNGAKPVNVTWAGNCLHRLDLYNSIFDPRVHPSEIHSEGEFAGYVQIMSRIRMKKLINNLYGKIPVPTAIRALESTLGIGGPNAASPLGYYVPLLNPVPLINQLPNQGFDWMAWAMAAKGKTNYVNYSNIYELLKLYVRILPADFDLRVPEANTPQVWKLLVVNRSVVLFFERLTNAHGFIPIFFGQPLEDGLDYQTKSFAMNVADMQDVASALWKGHLASKRRLVGDRILYDPLRIREADINSDNPSARIPVRPAAYGKNVQDAAYAFPYRDEQTNSLVQSAEMVVKFSNLINSQNPAQQGQFVKGNKTRKEYEDIMGHGNGHNQMIALMSEAQVFTPLKEVIKINILQYQGEKILYNQSQKQQVKIDPVELRKAAVHFRMADGLMNIDKLENGEDYGMALQVMGTSPALAQGYNLAPAFTYLLKLKGVDFSPFEKPREQLQYEQALGAWQQAAAEAAKAGTAFSTPMPQPPAQAPQQQSQKSIALESTVGTTS